MTLRPQLALEFVTVIPGASPLTPIDLPLTTAAQERETRAQALSTIAFDSSAELEYRAAYTASHSPRMLLAAATRLLPMRATTPWELPRPARSFRNSKRGAFRKFHPKLGEPRSLCHTNHSLLSAAAAQPGGPHARGRA